MGHPMDYSQDAPDTKETKSWAIHIGRPITAETFDFLCNAHVPLVAIPLH